MKKKDENTKKRKVSGNKNSFPETETVMLIRMSNLPHDETMASNSDDSDSDYAPEEEKEEETVVSSLKQLVDIPKSRKREIDSIFQEMMENDHDYMKKKAANSIVTAEKTKGEDLEQKKMKVSAKKLALLQSVFGNSVATSLVHSAASPAHKKRSREEKNDVALLAREAAKKVQRSSVKVEEKVKFAGQQISLSKMVKTSTAPLKTSEVAASGLDKVIDEMKGPKTISTVTESSSDWENFKEKEGIEDDLAVAAKGTINFVSSPCSSSFSYLVDCVDGYLHRKDFLNRCDVRAFETERDQRALNTKTTNI